MPHFDDITHRFLNHLREDVDTSVSLGLPDHLHRLGDPSLDAHWQEVERTRVLLADLENTAAEEFYQALDLDLMQRHLQQDLFSKTLENHGELQRRRKPAGVDGIREGGQLTGTVVICVDRRCQNQEKESELLHHHLQREIRAAAARRTSS